MRQESIPDLGSVAERAGVLFYRGKYPGGRGVIRETLHRNVRRLPAGPLAKRLPLPVGNAGKLPSPAGYSSQVGLLRTPRNPCLGRVGLEKISAPPRRSWGF